MKIFHISPSYKPAYIYGGPIQSVGKLCEALKASSLENDINHHETPIYKSFDVEVLTTSANGKSELDIEVEKPQTVNGVSVTYFKRWTKDHSHFSPALLNHLRKKLHNTKGQDTVLHIHSWWNLVSIFSCWIAKWYKIPVVLSPRGMLTAYTLGNRNSISKKIIHWVIGKSLLNYVHIHATSEQERADILQIFKPKSITIIPNLIDISNRVVNSGNDSQEVHPSFRIIFLSRIEEKKGLDLLFKALSLLNFEWTLMVAGSGDEHYVNQLKDNATQLALSNRIDWLGHIKNEDKFDLLHLSDLLVLTSYNENFANVIIESLSVGTPVLISNCVGLADYVEKKDLGWISTLDPKDIAQQITMAKENQGKRDYIRKHAPAIITQEFDDAAIVKKYIKLYQGIVNG